MWKATVLVVALLGQTIYTWTDKSGEEHFTDDPASIPKGAKAKVMQPAEIETVRAEPDVPPTPSTPAPVALAAPDAGVKPEVDTCVKARQALATAEDALAEAKKAAEVPQPRNCQAVLNTHGQAAYAQCMTQRASEGAEAAQRKVDAAQRSVDRAKDDLRRAQSAGCR